MATVGATIFEGRPSVARALQADVAVPAIHTRMNGRDWSILVLLSVLWGGSFFFIDVAVRDVPPLTFVWLRITIAAAALWSFLAWRGQPLALPQRALAALVLLALLNNVVPFTLFAWSQTRIAGGLASILNATTPIWGVIVAHYFTRDEPLTPARLAGVLLGFGGVALMIGPQLLAGLGGSALAQLACLAATSCYALAGVWARRFKAMGLTPGAVATWQFTAGAIVMLPLALAVERPWLMAAPSAVSWAAILALALFSTAFAYILYFRLIDSAGATNALLVALLIPVTAILLGALFLSEVLAPRDFAGMGLIAAGLAAIDGRLLERLRPRPA